MTLATINYILHLDIRDFLLERLAVLKAAQDSGLGIILVTSCTERYEKYDIEHLVNVPIGNYKVARRAILDYLQANNLSIKGIVGWSEEAVELVAQLGTELGLPSTSPDSARNVRNKANTRRLLEQHLPSANPKYAIVRNENEFEQALKIVGVPCILKPAGSTSSKGVFRISSYEEAFSKFYKYKEFCRPERDDIFSYFADEILVEELLSGSEHSVAGMVVNGNVVISAIIDQKVDFKIPAHYEKVTPSSLPNDLQNRIVEMASFAVGLTGINWCGFHVDLIVTSEGPKILEIGGRLGGDCINSHLIPLSIPNFQPYSLLLKIIQGINPFEKKCYIDEATSRAGWRAIFPPKPGRIAHIEGISEVQQHPRTRAFLQVRGERDEAILPSVQADSYALGYVVTQCDMDDDMETILQEISSLVTVKMDETTQIKTERTQTQEGL